MGRGGTLGEAVGAIVPKLGVDWTWDDVGVLATMSVDWVKNENAELRVGV